MPSIEAAVCTVEGAHLHMRLYSLACTAHTALAHYHAVPSCEASSVLCPGGTLAFKASKPWLLHSLPVRKLKPKNMSHTLHDVMSAGMLLKCSAAPESHLPMIGETLDGDLVPMLNI